MDVTKHVQNYHDEESWHLVPRHLLTCHAGVDGKAQAKDIEQMWRKNDCFYTKEDSRISCSMLIQATRNRNMAPLGKLNVQKTQKAQSEY